MDYPYWCCERCNDRPIAPARLPITKRTRVPVCPDCLDWRRIDVAIGDEETEMDTETVIFETEEA